jgi:hypothetical protein
VPTVYNEQRQTTRGRDGRYKNMDPCPRCGKRKTLEPAYKKCEGGQVNDNSKWAGDFICPACIKAEGKQAEAK